MGTDEMVRLYRSGRSLSQITAASGVPMSTVRFRLMANGVRLRTPAQGMTMAKREGRGISPLSGKYERTPGVRAKLSATRRLIMEKAARGFRVNSNGYIELTRGPHKGRPLHDVIGEAVLGRALRPDEVVHHKDRNRTNNAPENLEVMTSSEHGRLHALDRVKRGERMELHFTKGQDNGISQ